MNREPIAAEQEPKYSDHSQEGDDGTKSGLSWRNGGIILCEVESVDGGIER